MDICLIIPNIISNSPQVEDARFYTKIAKSVGLSSESTCLLFSTWNQDLAQPEKEILRAASLEDLHDPYLLHIMDKASWSYSPGYRARRWLLVYGDYDADGMTSALIVKESLEQLGQSVWSISQINFTDGYGPNASVYKYLSVTGCVFDCDGGQWVAGHEAIDLAQSMELDVIVTDHHSMPEALPNNVIVHPEHPESIILLNI